MKTVVAFSGGHGPVCSVNQDLDVPCPFMQCIEMLYELAAAIVQMRDTITWAPAIQQCQGKGADMPALQVA